MPILWVPSKHFAMKHQIQKLFDISHKQEKIILGLMSGTSLDGLDLALCKIRGSGVNTEIDLLNFTTLEYDKPFQQEVKKIFSKKEGSIELVVLLNTYIGKKHGEMINATLKNWAFKNEDVDVIASHGQTIYHAPFSLHKKEGYGNATLQIGDGDQIAVTTGILTISDFRMKHIACGGEGAPLVVYGDYLLFSHKTENRVLLNIGGISNFTWLPNKEFSTKKALFSTDVGPGNTIMDAYCQSTLGLACDFGGSLATSGNVDRELLNALLDHPFFDLDLPRTIGPELFNLNYLENAMEKSSTFMLLPKDVLATLNLFTATVIASSIQKELMPYAPFTIYVSGGGVHNKELMYKLQTLLPDVSVLPLSSLGVNGDAKEAMLFALLANELLSGEGLPLQSEINGMPNTSMGKICFPK